MKLSSCLVVFVLLLTSCTGGTAAPRPTNMAAATNAPTATQHILPTASTQITRAPDAGQAVTAFLDAWKAEDYAAMYGMLASLNQDAISQDDFTARYHDTAVNMTLQTIDYEILSQLTNPSSASVAYQVTYHTQVIGDVQKKMDVGLVLEKGAWKIQWDDGLILPELKGGNTLRITYDTPARGNIYDVNGVGMAIYSDIVALGLSVGELDPNQEGTLLRVLSDLTGKPPESIRALYKDKAPGDYVPVGEISKDTEQQHLQTLSSLSGLVRKDYSGRLYPDGGIAPHVTGYVSAIQKEEQDQYLRQGYSISDRVPRSGMELFADKYLGGVRGATLDVFDPQGRPVTRLGKVERKPSEYIYTTIDSKLQEEAQKAMSGFKGGLVVMERNTGKVLALVSAPEFDPNAFEFNNYNSYTLLSELSTSESTPEYNRATMDGYPLGSVFKIITLAAALETGTHKPSDVLDCQYKWYAPNGEGRAYTDWTLDFGFPPSGKLDLLQGLVRSCDPWFYQMGYDMFSGGFPKAVSDMARAFGLGSKTGIEGLQEASGNIPDPENWNDAVEMAIGQGKIQVNPLQVARFIAAVGNGGTLYKPEVISKITDADGNAAVTYQPQPTGTLPVKPENLKMIQDAMRKVVNDPSGTAVRVFGGMSIPIYGKTGTAQNDWQGHSHSWFAGYTDAQRSDKPDIAIAVIAENAGEGSEIAAPIFRRIIEVYFMGQPQRVYPWETKLNVTQTPTPLYSETPKSPESGGSGGNGGSGSSSGDSGGGDINIRTATPSP